MGNQTIVEKIKAIISNAAWRVFLWSLNMTAEEYWTAVYEQEKYIRSAAFDELLDELEEK